MTLRKKDFELRLIFFGIGALFLAFLFAPMIGIILKSFLGGEGITLEFYKSVFGRRDFLTALGNSFKIAAIAGVLASIAAFVIAYTINYTGAPTWFKKVIQVTATLPMLLPTIAYGFAIIYSLGNQGLLTKLLGRKLFDIYGFWGLLLGYSIYTLPVAFLLISNTMSYVDKKTIIVSKIMGDNYFQTMWIAVLRPLMGTFAGAFIQSFFLSFTDFGIPASVGGKYHVIATLLYNEMLGGIPDFNRGAVVAVVILLPSAGSILLLHALEKYNIRYDRISLAQHRYNKTADSLWGFSSSLLILVALSIFAVIFALPLIKHWPYQLSFTMDHVSSVFADDNLTGVYLNTLIMAFSTALVGTLVAYGAALVSARSHLPKFFKAGVDSLALITNTIPGMVLGLAYLFCFSGSFLQNTFYLMVVCNVIHYFSTPYLMMNNSLSKMNAGWETTGMLMGDSWGKTIVRVITPNAAGSLLSVFSYYFINAMVTISALIFIVGTDTMVLTTKIKQLQYFNKYNEVFVLSMLILFTNLVAKALLAGLAYNKTRKNNGGKKSKATKVRDISKGRKEF